MISPAYSKLLMMTFCIEKWRYCSNDSSNRADSLLQTNRPINGLYNLLQQDFKVLRLAFEIKTQFYNFFLYFYLFFLFIFFLFIFLLIIFVYISMIFFEFSIRGKKVKANANSSRVCGSRVKTNPLCLFWNFFGTKQSINLEN
jgi:hypothetical protein